MIKYSVHCFLLLLETAILIALGLTVIFSPFNSDDFLIHEQTFRTIAILASGMSALIMSMVYYLGSLRLTDEIRSRRIPLAISAVLFILGLVAVVRTVSVTIGDYPELFSLPAVPRSAAERADFFRAVKVSFDANGGVCCGESRVCKYLDRYSDEMNLYPTEDHRYFIGHNKMRLNLSEGCLHLQDENFHSGSAFGSYYVTNAVPFVLPNEKWTCVVDVLEFTGVAKDWLVGQTWNTNNNSYTQFGCGKINGNFHVGTYFVTLTATDYDHFNYLERAVIRTETGQKYNIKFRLSLFAGTAVNASNYHYVKPGETIACPLPVPTREGYEFAGWYDGEKRVTETTKVEKREAHTLKAWWRKRVELEGIR